MKIIKLLIASAVIAAMSIGCTTMSRSMKTPNNYVEFQKDDFEFSKQVTGEATQTKILGIDFARLFSKSYGEVTQAGMIQIPVVGTMLNGWVNMYALYNIMNENPGYDVVFYPTYESEKTGIPILFTTTKVKVKTRLAKIK